MTKIYSGRSFFISLRKVDTRKKFIQDVRFHFFEKSGYPCKNSSRTFIFISFEYWIPVGVKIHTGRLLDFHRKRTPVGRKFRSERLFSVFAKKRIPVCENLVQNACLRFLHKNRYPLVKFPIWGVRFHSFVKRGYPCG